MDNLTILKWREAKLLTTEDAALAEAFAERAAEVHSDVTFLLSAGLTEGAVAALTALAEEDMVDFCIMVDLASGMHMGGVTQLNAQTQQHLSEFLDQDPWYSLSVDNDITVTLAMIEDVLAHAPETPWHRTSPQLPVTLANLMDRVDREQFARFAQELDARLKRHPEMADGTGAGADGVALIREIVRTGARRVGAHPT